jgi:hypothetical protein
MNEKIKLLSEQATRNVESANSYHNWVFDKDLFAQLIVEECVSNLRLNGYDDAAETIVKHFGEENDN